MPLNSLSNYQVLGNPMSDERETKRLLNFRESLENRLNELDQEMQDVKVAIEELDKLIVSSGFRTFTTAETMVVKEQPKPKIEPTPPQKEAMPQKEETIEGDMNQSNITSKDGTVLGIMYIENHSLTFTPIDTFNFMVDIPPFQSFLIDRVLENMKKTDQERSENGELDPSEILEYQVNDEDGRISSLIIENYGGERRLREISSSLRWAFDKMYDKIIQG